MKRCVPCGLPETHETISFDGQGVCNICRGQEFRNTEIDWDAQKLALDQLIEQYRGKYDYDCLIPFSGGKDSAADASAQVRVACDAIGESTITGRTGIRFCSSSSRII